MESGIIFDVEDKSVVTDELVSLTGKSRAYWAVIPLVRLRQIYSGLVRRRWEAQVGTHKPSWTSFESQLTR